MLLALTLCALSSSSLFLSLAIADQTTGERIYRERCATCHGQHGEGAPDGYPEPISGGRSLAQLAGLIGKTMPQDSSEKCSGPDAEVVAAYIHETFLSDSKQSHRSPRIELTRLTVNQYRHTIAELLASLRHPARWNDNRGLLGYYNAIDEKGDGKRVLERLDSQIKFAFGPTSPVPDKMDPKVFSISWVGSVLAPETGEYEFIVRTENSVRLYVNDRLRPRIDAWIKSGDEKEYRATVRLLGGRVYPLTLHFTKQGQGGKKPDQPNAPIPPASIELAWKMPGRLEETIPQSRLSSIETPETLVVEAAFPPDDRSTGFERGTSITKEWDQATTDAAIEVADYIRGRLRDFAAVPELSAEHAPGVREFCARFVERAFRRPLSPQQRAVYVDAPFASTPDLETAIDRVVLMALKSPWFLYHEIKGESAKEFNTASRLAFVLWDAPPDAELLAAAATGKLATTEDVSAQARRMLADPQCDAKLREFFMHWMKLDQARGLNKEAAAFPEFDAAVAADLRTSLELFLEELIRSQSADFRQLFLSDVLYLNGRLSRLYGVELPADAPFQRISMNASDRAGILSHPYLMATFADTTSSSPIRRGVFLARGVLGRTLRPPPNAFVPLPPALHPDLNTRERVALQTKADACISCHGLINPLGFSLERYDAIGRIRGEDNHRPIDASGFYRSRAGDDVRFNGARELAAFLAGSEETHAAFVEKLFYYCVQQPIRAFGPKAHEDLRESFVRQDFNIRKLLEEIATRAALVDRDQEPLTSPVKGT